MRLVIFAPPLLDRIGGLLRLFSFLVTYAYLILSLKRERQYPALLSVGWQALIMALDNVDKQADNWLCA